MEFPWQNSDASYDARMLTSENLSVHLDDLQDKSVEYIDHDYLRFHRLVMGQPATQEKCSRPDLGNSTDARSCVMPAEISPDNIKIEQSFYVTDHSDVEVLDNAAVAEQRIPNSLVPSTRNLIIAEDDPAQAVESASAMEFRRSVMCVLTKPFDKIEYAELWNLFRDGAYRRSNPDVGKKLAEYWYRKEKRLNILRGFFFWLQNVTQEGSFEPWEDSECLAV